MYDVPPRSVTTPETPGAVLPGPDRTVSIGIRMVDDGAIQCDVGSCDGVLAQQSRRQRTL